MKPKLGVAFDDPEHGWIELTINYGIESFTIVASDVPGDSLFDLTRALRDLLLYDGQATVTWYAEPIEYDMLFSKRGLDVKLEIYEYADHPRGSEVSKHILTILGTYADVCIPFWRALRNLQSRLPQDSGSLWTRPFPLHEIEMLTREIKETS